MVQEAKDVLTIRYPEALARIGDEIFKAAGKH